MKLLGFALIAAGLLAAASTEAAAGRRIAGPYYVSYPYPYTRTAGAAGMTPTRTGTTGA